MLRSHNRYPYSAITRRPQFAWPGGRRLAVYLALNLEHYAFAEGLAEQLVPGEAQPDVLNYSWQDYGNRVAAWRLLKLFEGMQMPVTLLVNSEIYGHCPELVAAYRQQAAEVAAHGRTNSERQSSLDETQERALIEGVTREIERHEQRRPAGWLGPWIAETERTPDLLKESGYRYLLDWCADDQPFFLTTRSGPLLAVPYPQEINDSAAIIGRQVSAEAFAGMIRDQFDEMLAQSAEQSIVMGIALHPCIVGQPFRIRHLRSVLEHIARRREAVWLTTAGAIAQHYLDLAVPAGEPPAPLRAPAPK